MIQADLNITLDQRSAVPLYEQICQQIRQKIETRQLQPGAPLPTNHELRARLQVNYKTAQQAMATLAKEGYVTRQARRGTVVKGIPRRGVVAIYSHIDLVDEDGKHEYYRLITGYISRLLENNGRVHRLYLGSVTPDTPNTAGEDLLRHLAGGTLCGALLVTSPPHMEELVRQGRALHVPVVALCGASDVDYSVRTNFPGYVRAAAQYLHGQGCRRVGVIFNSSSPSFKDPEVLRGILKESGYAPKSSWIVGRIETEQGGYDAMSGIPLKELDGLIVEDDVMALGVDRRLCELDVDVLGDLKVATLWNQGSRLRLTLPFERFELDVLKQARLGLQIVQDAISGQRLHERHLKVVPTHCPSAGPNAHARLFGRN